MAKMKQFISNVKEFGFCITVYSTVLNYFYELIDKYYPPRLKSVSPERVDEIIEKVMQEDPWEFKK